MRKLTLITLLLLAIVALAACGGGSSSSGSSSGESTSSTESGGAEESGETGESEGSGEAEGSGESGESATASTPEGEWAEEVTEVFTEFENEVSARLTEEISSASSPKTAKPLYATYSIDLSVLGNKLESTKPPKACVAMQEKMVGYVRKVAALTKELGSNGRGAHMKTENYEVLVAEQSQHIDHLGQRLGKLTTDISC